MAERIFEIITHQNVNYTIKCPKLRLKNEIINKIKEVQNIPTDQIIIIDLEKNVAFDCNRGGFETQIQSQDNKQYKVYDANVLYKENIESKIIIEELRKIINQKDNELQLINGKYKTLEEERNNQIANLQQESKNSKDQIVNQLEKVIESKNKEIQEIEGHVAIQTKENQNLNQKIMELNNMMEKQKKNFEAQEQEYQNKINDQEQNYKKLQQEYNILYTQLSDCVQTYYQCQQNFSNEIAKCGAQLQEAQNQIITLQSDLTTQADKYKKEIENLKKRNTDLENEKELDISKLNAEILKEKSSSKILHKDNTQLRLDLQDYQQQLSKYFQQIPQFQKQQQYQPLQQFNTQMMQSQGISQDIH